VKFCKIHLFKFLHSAIRIPQSTPSLISKVDGKHLIAFIHWLAVDLFHEQPTADQ